MICSLLGGWSTKSRKFILDCVFVPDSKTGTRISFKVTEHTSHGKNTQINQTVKKSPRDLTLLDIILKGMNTLLSTLTGHSQETWIFPLCLSCSRQASIKFKIMSPSEVLTPLRQVQPIFSLNMSESQNLKPKTKSKFLLNTVKSKLSHFFFCECLQALLSPS